MLSRAGARSRESFTSEKPQDENGAECRPEEDSEEICHEITHFNLHRSMGVFTHEPYAL
jgi:hypothetical protein